jgi:Methane oxygenase PmoA
MRDSPTSRRHWLRSALWLPMLWGMPARAQQPAALRVEVIPHEDQRRVDITVDGKPFTSYIYPPTLKKPTLYPLVSAAGTVVTRGWPLEPRPGERVDHPHQVGMWFTHENVNGLDFWNNSDAIPRARASSMGTILHRAVRRAEGGPGEGVLEVTAEWVDAHGAALLREDTRFVFRASPDMRGIDRVTTLTALARTVTFTDAKDGLFGLRVTRALEQPATTAEVYTDASGHATTVPVLSNAGVMGHYRSSDGLEGDAVWGTRGRWCMLSGVVEGAPVTIAILDHPTNVGFPTYWHARGYGLFAANPLGPKVFSHGKEQLNLRLEPGAARTFRYRVLILSGPTKPEQIEQYYQDFAR